MTELTITINGKKHRKNVDPESLEKVKTDHRLIATVINEVGKEYLKK